MPAGQLLPGRVVGWQGCAAADAARGVVLWPLGAGRGFDDAAAALVAVGPLGGLLGFARAVMGERGGHGAPEKTKPARRMPGGLVMKGTITR